MMTESTLVVLINDVDDNPPKFFADRYYIPAIGEMPVEVRCSCYLRQISILDFLAKLELMELAAPMFTDNLDVIREYGENAQKVVSFISCNVALVNHQHRTSTRRGPVFSQSIFSTV